MSASDITGLSPTAFEHKQIIRFISDIKDLFD